MKFALGSKNIFDLEAGKEKSTFVSSWCAGLDTFPEPFLSPLQSFP